MKKVLIISAIITIIVWLAVTNNHVSSKTYYAMGTNLTITIAEKTFDNNIFDLAFKEFKNVEKLFKDTPNLANPEVQKIYHSALELQKDTDGAFSPFLNKVLKLWQFNKTNKTITNPPRQKQIEQALKSKEVNLYAIAKGYGIDKVATVLKQNNINNFIVDAGGDLFVSGTKFGKNWSIGLKHSNKVLTCQLPEYAIATSSNLYNSYDFNGVKYGHLINGKTGWPTPADKSITVLTKNATLADGLATAVFVDETLIKKAIRDLDFIIFKQTEKNFSTFNMPKNCKLRNFGL